MRKIVLISLAAIMFFATACSSSEGGDSEPAISPTISNNANTSVEIFDENSSTASQSSATSGTTVSTQTPDSDVNTETPEISSTVTASHQTPEQSTVKEENPLSIEITVNGRTFSATLYDNETAIAFSERLPLTLNMSELNGNEKYFYLSDDLPTNSSRPSKINNGDIMLYGSDCLVIFYESFSTSYSYTPIGKIDDPAGLAAALGSGSVQVTFN